MNKYRIISFFAILGIFLGANAAGVEADSCRRQLPGWPRAAVSLGITAGVNAGLTEALKHSVHEWRPNLEDDRSFPSRHTSWAFAASTYLSNTFYRRAPWVPLAAQALATGVGLQRVHCGAHYGGDVAAGMVVGAGSAVVGDVLSRLIFRSHGCAAGTAVVAGPSLSVYSEVLLPLSRGVRGWHSGFAGTVRGEWPLWRCLGVGLSATAWAVSRAQSPHSRYVPAAEGLTFMAGATVLQPLAQSPLAITAGAEAGGAYVRRCADNKAFAARGRAGLRWQLTRHFAASLEGSWFYLSQPRLSTLAVGAASTYIF